jgi:hypothetical protein
VKNVVHVVAALIALPLCSVSGGAFAQQGALMQVVLDTCAGTSGAGCVGAVRSALDTFPAGPARDRDILELIADLAAEARNPSVTQEICLDIAAGIRFAGTALTSAADNAATQTLADSLCDDALETATIPDLTPPQSLIDNQTSSPPVVKEVEPPVDDDTPDEEEQPEQPPT